jgi:hypothetical protein
MSTEIELFRGPGLTTLGRIPLDSVVRTALARILGRDTTGASVMLVLLEVAEADGLDGSPAVRNLMPEYGYAAVIVSVDGRVLYRHPHPLSELVAAPLQGMLNESMPEETQWGYCLVGPGVPRRTVRPMPAVEGVVSIPLAQAGEAPSFPFRIRRVPDEPLPAARLADFGVAPGNGVDQAFVKVLVSRGVHAELMGNRTYSSSVEEGGFLVGRAYQDQDVEGTFLLEVTAALNAEYTGASLLHFTFTGDSFDAVKRSLRESHPGKRLLGWYHTHLFAASEEMGLSSVDVNLHFTTFRVPWQLAGLINLDGAHRTLRFYVRRENRMVLCPQWVIDERP